MKVVVCISLYFSVAYEFYEVGEGGVISRKQGLEWAPSVTFCGKIQLGHLAHLKAVPNFRTPERANESGRKSALPSQQSAEDNRARAKFWPQVA